MQITIKERPLASGNKTLYLEYYEKGFRKKENLHLTIYPSEVSGSKKLNKAAYAQAQAIRADRLLNPPAFLSPTPKEDETQNVKRKTQNDSITWSHWAEEYARILQREGRRKSQVDHRRVVAKRIAEYLASIKRSKLLLRDVTTKHISGLYRYMRDEYRNPQQIKQNEGRLSDFTLMLFGQAINAMFNRAYRDGLVLHNPVGGLSPMERFHTPDTHREHLTADELERFLTAPTTSATEHTIQQAFGFASMTGLRLSDIRRLTWSHIKPHHDGYDVTIRQQKTQAWVTIPLNQKALSLLPGTPSAPHDMDTPLFPLPKKADNVAKYVRRIASTAGIEKDITFHCSRHTVATLAISTGADLSTVGKILGHKSSVSTQVYAKVSLEKKVAVVKLVDGVFG